MMQLVQIILTCYIFHLNDLFVEMFEMYDWHGVLGK